MILEFLKEKTKYKIIVELRSNKNIDENLEEDDFKNILRNFMKKIFSLEQINYFDSWAGQISQEELPTVWYWVQNH